MDIRPDLARIDIESSDDIDIARQVPADLRVHQPGHSGRAPLRCVIVNSLDQRARTVAHACDRNANAAFRHFL